jgi:hypothetical protein
MSRVCFRRQAFNRPLTLEIRQSSRPREKTMPFQYLTSSSKDAYSDHNWQIMSSAYEQAAFILDISDVHDVPQALLVAYRRLAPACRLSRGCWRSIAPECARK